jgi:hypothetical protein
VAIDRDTGMAGPSEPSDDFNDVCVSQHYKSQAMWIPAFFLAVQAVVALCEH